VIQIDPDEAPIINLRGDNVALGPLGREILPLLARWENDFETAFLAGDNIEPRTRESIVAGFERLIMGERPGFFGFSIYKLPELRLIGHANLRDVDHQHRTAEFGIYIGEPACRGKGYGTETTKLLLDYGFSILGLHNIWLDTASYNERAIAAYQRAGFRIIGRRREALRRGDRLYDSILMDCLASEFLSQFPPVVEATTDSGGQLRSSV
jgi:RimJ/RimL family protein N-acetyltransferase